MCSNLEGSGGCKGIELPAHMERAKIFSGSKRGTAFGGLTIGDSGENCKVIKK